jgi:gluconokinase
VRGVTPRIVVVMGVSGSGKTTVGQKIASLLGFAFCDGDDLHSPANIDKMRRGVPLDDADRSEWLRLVRERIDRARRSDEALVVACSALKESYRRALGLPDRSVALVYLRVSLAVVEERMRERKDHFMPPALAPSQYAILEEPEDAIVVDADQPPDSVAGQVVRELASPRQ